MIDTGNERIWRKWTAHVKLRHGGPVKRHITLFNQVIDAAALGPRPNPFGMNQVMRRGVNGGQSGRSCGAAPEVFRAAPAQFGDAGYLVERKPQRHLDAPSH